MRRHPVPALCVAFLISAVAATAVVFTWTGIGNGWQGQVTPPNDGTANLVFGDNVSTFIKIPSPVFSINSVTFTSDNRFLFQPQSGSTILNLGMGGLTVANSGNDSATVDFDPNVIVDLTAAQTWDFGNGGGSAIIHGVLTDSGNLTVTGSSSNNSFGLVLANPSSYANSGYSGNITLGNSTTPNLVPFVVVWASGNLGTGSLTFVNGGQLITHNVPTLANNLVLNSGPLPAGNNGGVFTPVSFKPWDGEMTLTGNLTLANNATIVAQLANPNIPSSAPGNTGSFPVPGPRTRYPVIISGAIGETGGARSLTVGGAGIFLLNTATANTYTGGTTVNGSLIFGTTTAIPGGSNNIMINNQGYVGLGDLPTIGANGFAALMAAHFNVTSGGAIGIDTLPGNGTVNSTEPINLSTNLGNGNGGAPMGFTNSNIRLGTATSAWLGGSIGMTPAGNDYQFGNGGGTLTIAFPVTDTAGNGTLVTGRKVVLTNNSVVPLKLYLTGPSNFYTGGTVANNGFIIFDGLSGNSIPVNGQFVAAGGSGNTGNSYIGYTDHTPLTPTTFLAKFDKTNTWGIVGFDTTAGNSTVTFGNIDLTGFNNGVFIGTATSANLNGAITPTADGILRLTAGNGGSLGVGTNLTGSLGLVLGSPSTIPAMSDGTITLSGANTYTGNTLVNNFGNVSLVAGSSGAFGTGFINLQPHGGVLGLSAGSPGVNLPNAINFLSTGVGTGTNFTPTVNLTGYDALTLSGSISGPDRTQMFTVNDKGQGMIALHNDIPVNATISGNNSGFYGTFLVADGTMTFTTDNAAGHAQVEMPGAGGTVAFTSAAPVVYGLRNGEGGGATVTLGGSTNLTVDTINTDGTGSTGEGHGNYEFEFGGSFVGGAGSSLTVTNSGMGFNGTEFFYAYGASPGFSGSVNVTGRGALALGQSSSVGSGPIYLNAIDGGLALNTGVTLTNPLSFNQGGLAGIGTFDPVSVAGTGQTTGRITFGANQKVFAGIPGEDAMTGTLTIGGANVTAVEFATGGTLQWDLQDPAASDGYSLLYISGNLDITASPGGFTLALESIGPDGKTGYNTLLVPGQSYSLRLAQTSGIINGFNTAAFTIDATKFQAGLMQPGDFFITNPDSEHLYLNFTAVPEPSTWALLVTGAGFLGLAAWRRSRRTS